MTVWIRRRRLYSALFEAGIAILKIRIRGNKRIKALAYREFISITVSVDLIDFVTVIFVIIFDLFHALYPVTVLLDYPR